MCHLQHNVEFVRHDQGRQLTFHESHAALEADDFPARFGECQQDA
jgi:hypothetical protein